MGRTTRPPTLCYEISKYELDDVYDEWVPVCHGELPESASVSEHSIRVPKTKIGTVTLERGDLAVEFHVAIMCKNPQFKMWTSEDLSLSYPSPEDIEKNTTYLGGYLDCDVVEQRGLSYDVRLDSVAGKCHFEISINLYMMEFDLGTVREYIRLTDQYKHYQTCVKSVKQIKSDKFQLTCALKRKRQEYTADEDHVAATCVRLERKKMQLDKAFKKLVYIPYERAKELDAY